MPYDTITDVKSLRETYPEPKGAPVEKVLYELDEHCRNFIARSPFLILGTNGDVSPKGDHPGFVIVSQKIAFVLLSILDSSKSRSVKSIFFAVIPKSGRILLNIV